MKKSVSLLLAILLAVSMAGIGTCAVAEEEAEHIDSIVILDSAWEGLDMFQCSSWNDMQCLFADSILVKADDGSALPGIASESVWSEDGLTWTLTFPEGMYYYNGEQLEPEDVVASIEWGLEVSPFAEGYENIESMEIDGRDVIIHLTEFQADMEYNFMSCFIGVIDKDELESKTADELMWDCHPYGPYYVEEYVPGDHATLKANPYYTTNNPLVENKGACTVETVTIMVPDASEAFTAYTGITTGEYDVLATAPADYLSDLMDDDSITVVDATGASVKYIEMNITNEFLSDINVRKAIILAFNRENLAVYLDEYYTPVTCLIMDNCLNYDAYASEYYEENYGYDPEAAKALLAESGYEDTDGDGYVEKDGKTLTLTYDSRDTDSSITVAQSLQADLKEIGIQMEITTQDWSYVNQDVEDGNFDMAYLGLGWSEPMLLVRRFCNRNAECTNLDPEGYDELVQAAATCVDYDERTEIITEIQIKLFDYCTIIPVLQDHDYRCWRSEIEGIVYNDNGSFYLNDVK